MALLTFVGILNETAMNVTYPELVRIFNVSIGVVQWITTGYLLMVTIVMGTTAYLLRQYPARRLALVAVLMFVVGDVIGACAVNFPLLLVARLIQATATGLSTPILFHLIFTEIPANQKGIMTGFAGMVISFAPAIGPTYGGIVSETMSWRMIFWLILPLALVSLVVGQLTIRNQPIGNTKRFSYLSLLLLSLALITVIYSMSLIGNNGLTGPFWLFLCIGLFLALLFIYVNNHGRSQLLNLSIFRVVPIRLSTITYFNLQFINIGISLVIPVYMQYVLHSSAMVAGLVLLSGSLVGALLAPFGGRWADQQGYAQPVTTGSVLLVIGALCFIIFQAELTAITVTIFFLILRIGFNLAFPNTISNASMLVEQENSSDVNSVFNMVQQFAGSMGTGLLASLISYFQKQTTGSAAQRTMVGGRLDYLIVTCLAILTFITVVCNYQIQRKK
ncbi:MAG: MFS transporter [Limosilactobacillus sp.]|jgi:EmrB/QacA subfamily drug resistance transporter|uniref:MFS transporter n=1 Tax=Limosilactobacillus sp. TaxID=2773925 RepID=UPI0025BF0421|nr:MFS transporter [Limosilactobacillus sp.]MCI1975606.1 MFS transporter [Limosilactobacillus sp.]MCI2031575.1 MFS transporter [Limosilactobacillus sp.]